PYARLPRSRTPASQPQAACRDSRRSWSSAVARRRLPIRGSKKYIAPAPSAVPAKNARVVPMIGPFRMRVGPAGQRGTFGCKPHTQNPLDFALPLACVEKGTGSERVHVFLSECRLSRGACPPFNALRGPAQFHVEQKR